MVDSDSENSELNNLITKIEKSELMKKENMINLKMDTVKPEKVEFNPNITKISTQAETSQTSFSKSTKGYAGIDAVLKIKDSHTPIGSMKRSPNI